jgi:glycosyltransferase involved in cell wall biosynthesis
MKKKSITNSSTFSIMIPIFNEERHLRRVLKSALEVTPFVYIVDSKSNDNSLNIAKEFDCIVLQSPPLNYKTDNWSTKLNWGIKNNPFNTDWMMRLDADELIDFNLKKNIINFLNSDNSKNFDVCKFNKAFYFMKKRIRFGGYFRNFQVRMHKLNNLIQYENRRTDEHLSGYKKVYALKGLLIEDPIISIQEWLSKHVMYSQFEARVILLESKNESTYIANMGFFPNLKRFMKTKVFYKLPLFFRGLGYFLYRYIFLLGFLDGVRGLIYHFVHAFCYRLFIDLTIYEYKNKIYDNVTEKNNQMDKSSYV